MLDSLKNSFVGARLMDVELVDHTWVFSFDKASVTTLTYWRLISDGALRVSSSDHGHNFGRPAPVDAAAVVRERMAGIAVAYAAFVAGVGDLIVTFEDGAAIEFLNTSGGYEGWHLFGECEAVALGGGAITTSDTWVQD